MKKPFVISIAALSGGGKTATVSALKKRLVNSAVLNWDDYGDEVDLDRDINEWSANGGDYNEWHTEPIAADIKRLLDEPYEYIILDYPFGYLNDCVGKLIDMTVFIDTPLDVALARRIIRDYTSRNTKYDFGLADVEEVSLAGLDKELCFYLECSRSTYARMPETHKPMSDLIVDGRKLPEEIAEEIINAIRIANETDEERRARIYPVILSEYNPAWTEWFVEEKANLERLIDADNIVRISHIGSTSVPGLTAKPTVDIILEITETTDLEKLISSVLLSPEYICLREDDLTISTPPPHLRFIKGYLPDGFAKKVYHIHVVYSNDNDTQDKLLFRDYLIAHPEAVTEYAELKRKLFEDYEHNRDGYTEAKGAFIKEIIEKARGFI